MYTDTVFQNPDVISFSQKLIEQLYCGTASDILACLNHNIVWVDTTIPCSLYGYLRIRSFLEQKQKNTHRQICHLQYHLSQPFSGMYIITGKFRVIAKANGGSGCSHAYLISMLWQTEALSPSLLHLHISTATPVFTASKPIYFHGRRAETYQLFPDEILYVEAENMNSVIHSFSDTFAVCRSISQIEKELPGHFLRIHRSYIVNRNYISRVYRYAVELSNRLELPIPEKKYMNVVCQIERYEA